MEETGMSNPTPPADVPLASDQLTSGEYSYGYAIPEMGSYSFPESMPAEVVNADPVGEVASQSVDEMIDPETASALEKTMETEHVDEQGITESKVQEEISADNNIQGDMPEEAFVAQAPPVPPEFVTSPWANLSFLSTPDPMHTPGPEWLEETQSQADAPVSPATASSPDIVNSPWADLSFLSTPGPMPTPDPELAEATQPQPASAVSPTAGSSPDVHPTEMPQTPVSPGIAETAGSEAQDDVNKASPVNVETPAPSAIETPPAPVAAPPTPITAEPNKAAGEMPAGATAPTGALGTAPIHPEPQAPAAVDMQLQMSENMVEYMANVLHDILQQSAPD